MKRILLVVRASTTQQETESQKNELRDYVLSLGYAVDEITYLVSAGASARKANQKYLDMLEDIKRICTEPSSTIKAVAIWHINRLGRIESYLMMMKEFFISNHIQLYIKNPSLTLFNTDNSVNSGVDIAFSVFSTLVKHETEEMMQKLHRGKQRNREQGKIADGGIPWGMYVDENGYFRVDEKKRKHIEHIFSSYANGESASYIRDYLAQYGFSTSTTHVYRMLKNERYRNIVGDELFDNVQNIKKDKITRPTSAHSYHIGQQIITCCGCGRHYYRSRDFYTCIGTRTPIPTKCPYAAHIRGFRLDSIILHSTMIWLMRYYKESASRRENEIKDEVLSIEEQISVLNAKYEEIDGKKERITDSFINGYINAEKRDMKMSEIETDSLMIKDKISRLVSRKNTLLDINTDDMKNTIDHLNDMLSDMETMDKKEIYDIVHKTIRNVEIKVDGKYKIIRTLSTNYDDYRMYIMYGIGQGYKLYYCKREKIDSGEDFEKCRERCEDVTNKDNFKIKL